MNSSLPDNKTKNVCSYTEEIAVTGGYKQGESKTVDKSVMDICLSHIN